MYYAFAEDNLPGQPQRTETEMRFIDIRPLKREYRVIDPDPRNGGGMNGGPGLKSLEELIQRQRFALNRTVLIEKRAKAGRKPDAASLEQLMQFETELAQNVRDTAQGLEARGFDDTELFYQAEAAMLQAVDSLSVAKWESATQQMKDALKALIEQRDRTATSILKNPDPARLATLRAFDRMQAQKLRRPKTDKEEARELIRRLEALVNQEATVAGALTDDTPKTDDAPPSAAVPSNE
jgi:adenine-specific DNA methylase